MLVAGLVLAACGGKDETLGPTATVPQPTTTVDPYAVPDVIDEAYVNRVLAGLDQVVGNVTRLVVGTRSVPPEVIDRLKALYVDGDALQLVVDIYQHDLLADLEGIRANPGNRRTAITQLISADPDCVFAKVHTDASLVSSLPRAEYDQWIAIVRTEESIYNPTGWGFIYEGMTPELTAPEDPCDES